MTKSIDWAAIREKLPTEKTEEQKAKRSEIFDQFDPNGNGYLSLAEVDKGCRDVLGLYELFECKKVIMRSFQAAKKAHDAKASGSDDLGPDFVQKVEFRLLLVYLGKYFELWQMFEQIDDGNDQRINMEEFKNAIQLLESWGVKVDDPDATFSEIDVNGGGQLLFDEFADWAIQKGLELEDDDA
jgi:Ca2+-binding EF-hand superfamily protein